MGHQIINLNTNSGACSLSSNTQRYNNKKNNISIKKDNLNKKNISSNNTNSIISNNINSNRAYKKRKLLSYTNEEVNKLMDSNNHNYLNKHKSPRQTDNKNTNINDNYLKTINVNPTHGQKIPNNIRKIN